MRGEMMEMSQKMMDVVDVRIEGMEDMLQHLQTTVHQLDSKVSSHSVTSQCRSGATVLKVGGTNSASTPHFLASGGDKILRRYLSQPNSYVCFVAD